ncbi:hypothetical protein BD626DRAFT_5427 [Schizophyllum amplum]|uniref:Impact N-terminal domain-containing protein n=1 Tax=Schizophyllum amplum TaxID=97359 RepID=A0A550CWB9_9AGAR|nr:hypothetical protein BD626DRAFT_5427 [Auriculariopsis ampla]
MTDAPKSHTLDAFIQHSKPPPTPIATSQEIRDRGSIFVANVFRAATLNEVQRCVKHLRNVAHGARPASHEMHAWRCMQTRPGMTGLGGPEEFELVKGSADDGEQWSGNRILKVMEAHGTLDAVVVVSRWYGGVMLGPSRFTHIESCAAEVCQTFKKKVEADELLTTLTTLDDLLVDLRAELAEKRTLRANQDAAKANEDAARADGESVKAGGESVKTGGASVKAGAAPVQAKTPDYASWIETDFAKARRLVRARELSIKAVKTALAKLEAEAKVEAEAEAGTKAGAVNQAGTVTEAGAMTEAGTVAEAGAATEAPPL